MHPVSGNHPTPLPRSIAPENRDLVGQRHRPPSLQWLELRSARRRPGVYPLMKDVCDRIIGLALFLIFLPVMIAGALLVRFSSNGPALYSQIRVGRAGTTFWIYKLRTMYHNCEAASGAKWCTRGDNRVTGVGRWLRWLHVDELPQLWNVVRGDMSLIGPRPERPEFVTPLDNMIPGYVRRLMVKPGITGFAQIQRPADTDVESVRHKLAYDICYIDRLSASLDVRIAIGTMLYLAGVSYIGIRQLLRLPFVRSDISMTDTVLE